MLPPILARNSVPTYVAREIGPGRATAFDSTVCEAPAPRLALVFARNVYYGRGMRRVLVGIVFVFVLSAHAASPQQIIESAAPFDGAIGGISDITTIAHLPGYGLNVNARYLGNFDLDTVVEQLQATVLGLSALVRGLEAGDMVSVAWQGRGFGSDTVFVVVRMVPGDPSSLETYVDGDAR